MITDLEIFNVYSAMENICIDISSIVNALNQSMANKQFINTGALRWDCSESLNSPTDWLPYFTQSRYTKKNITNKCLGINILLKDHSINSTIPFVTCGVQISKEALPRKNNFFYAAGWHPEADNQLIPSTPFTLTTDSEVSTLSYFLRLTSISNLENLEKLIAIPLIELLDIFDTNNFDTAHPEPNIIAIGNKISPHTITLEQILGNTPF